MKKLKIVTGDRDRLQNDAQMQLLDYICTGNLDARETLLELDRQLTHRGTVTAVADAAGRDKESHTADPGLTPDTLLNDTQ